MKPRKPFRLPPEKQRLLKRAVALEWITLGALLSITAVMYLTMGSSQAMKTAWIEDILSLIPPITFLVATRFRHRAPTHAFPYGYRRATLLAFLAASVAILGLGLYLLIDSAEALLTHDHPTLAHFTLLGTRWDIWSGWIMIAALIYSMIPPVILGHLKLKLACQLHEKTLHADAAMNKADWMTAAAAILGILGVGAGLWWADAVAAGFIALDVTKDGVDNIKRSIGDLMDRSPTEVGSDKPLDLADRVLDTVRAFPGVRQADLRLREEGHIISGEIFVVLAPLESGEDPAKFVEEIAAKAAAIDWRLRELVVMPVSKL